MGDLKREHSQFLPLIFRPNPMIQLFSKVVKNRREVQIRPLVELSVKNEIKPMDKFSREREVLQFQ